ncbi:hypothetical protein E2C01_090580 [Portunus trituberculatus]|uniref:Uncharacterized protein n=1 Tax=Portunus trituberculatus TaxID=210409 RepID=A0A5B7JLR4_PORTR|nr:hypothetical protein [Portunus trituberculatus]
MSSNTLSPVHEGAAKFGAQEGQERPAAGRHGGPGRRGAVRGVATADGAAEGVGRAREVVRQALLHLRRLRRPQQTVTAPRVWKAVPPLHLGAKGEHSRNYTTFARWKKLAVPKWMLPCTEQRLYL